MINRILIRIKVIQILYSFLIAEKQFTLESVPEQPSKEKRFSYALYLDMLVLMIKVAQNVERRKNDYPLAQTRFIKRLLSDETVKSTLMKYSHQPFPYQGLIASLSEKVKESAIYKRFLKDCDNDFSAAEERVWNDLFNLLIYPDAEVNAVTSRRENYTLKGTERMNEMIGTTLVNFLASQENVTEVERALESSLDKSRELYFRLLLLPVELTELQERRLDDNRHKHLKTDEDINPNLRFVENRVVDELRHNEVFQAYIKQNKLSWITEEPVMMRKLLSVITESPIYAEYMSDPESDIHRDGEFWKNVYKKIILENQDFLETLEEKSVFWNDDLEILSTFVYKTIRRIEEGEGANAVLDKYKDEEDARFGAELLRALYRNKESYREYIDNALESGNWESERLAFMDVVILECALAEILNFPKIPLNVSVNEYIELAKSYSTAKSGVFVHGLLGSIVKRLQKEGKLLKK